jgi:hypothetical protein
MKEVSMRKKLFFWKENKVAVGSRCRRICRYLILSHQKK